MTSRAIASIPTAQPARTNTSPAWSPRLGVTSATVGPSLLYCPVSRRKANPDKIDAAAEAQTQRSTPAR